ncbi:MaoC family dehydratase N-terminal domain-containing protein [Brevibacillus humidisoli]|uniref:MaoC/PaaZ C-terminal domain-containing protein n=1 Tax=Brevibacillus humidisoli TaxID=2895522 RepID=UPI001E4BE1DB|nr:MaoC/PaaZ C-terminal domain-containing protein [Brevibacillus humidisoli]UFJ39498.1 MaoC family dehydratase N-terminal domain-containing protein [Brevibacillus humidisoli]
MKELPILHKQAITHTQLVRYAGASGDFNPIHTVVPVAKQAGLQDVIAHGMLVMGFAGQALTEWFPRQYLRSFQVRFSRMTYPGEQLSVSGQLVESMVRDGEERWLGELIVTNQTGEAKLKGTFEVWKGEPEGSENLPLIP